MAAVPTPTPPLVSATNGNPRRPVSGTGGTSRVTRTSTPRGRAPRRRRGAVWAGVALAALVLVALIVFMLQNVQPVLISFLGMQGTVPLVVALLIAGAGVGIVALVVGAVRAAQRRRGGRHPR